MEESFSWQLSKYLSSKSDSTMYLTNNFQHLVAKFYSVKFKVDSFKMKNVKVYHEVYILVIK